MPAWHRRRSDPLAEQLQLTALGLLSKEPGRPPPGAFEFTQSLPPCLEKTLRTDGNGRSLFGLRAAARTSAQSDRLPDGLDTAAEAAGLAFTHFYLVVQLKKESRLYQKRCLLLWEVCKSIV